MNTYKVEYVIRNTYSMEVSAQTPELAQKFAKAQIEEGIFGEGEDGHEFESWGRGTVKTIARLT